MFKEVISMKKLVLSLLVLTPVTSLMADAKFDPVTRKFYTVPASPYINQTEYHNLISDLGRIFMQWLNANGYDLVSLSSIAKTMSQAQFQIYITQLIQNDPAMSKQCIYAVCSYLAAFNTPTADRLAMDIVKGFVFGYGTN